MLKYNYDFHLVTYALVFLISFDYIIFVLPQLQDDLPKPGQGPRPGGAPVAART